MASQAPNSSGPKSPPAIWQAFSRQASWMNWALVAQFVVIGLLIIANIRLAGRSPEFVIVDGATGDSVMVRSSPSTDALLRLVAEKTRPPKVAIARFARDFLHLALAVNSSTIDTSWPATLAFMSPGLRAKIEKDAADQKTIDNYKGAQRKTEIVFESIEIIDRTSTLVAVRAVMKRTISPLVDRAPGPLPSATDRIQSDIVLALTTPTIDKPDGLEVMEWRLASLENVAASPATQTNKETSRAQ